MSPTGNIGTLTWVPSKYGRTFSNWCSALWLESLTISVKELIAVNLQTYCTADLLDKLFLMM